MQTDEAAATTNPADACAAPAALLNADAVPIGVPLEWPVVDATVRCCSVAARPA
ncbi:hypothetical protein QYH69_17010 [Paraburkholderia sp. SARCC-3016]|jgi:hypothetical protein|uniref:hypothetical protein n=1 Tax=Paraburkholderia sp. SARCC-3016 TaxID=3058611 RepID=UPI0028079DAE|nr:hypothetical protein [Paraburkholderia sp. SARCC-3016]MDQ7978950.1 hypothetical protein [Paraburkholderia sp. SARCC-3016]